MCIHNKVNVTPTIDTVWGVDDCYNITCSICKEMLYEEVPKDDLKDIIKNNNLIIQLGEKYVF